MASKFDIKKKITPKDWNPKKLLAMPDEIRSLTLGTIIGIASGVSVGTDPRTGEQFEGLRGKFAFESVIDKRPDGSPVMIASEIFYPPSDMCGDIYEAVRPTDANPEPSTVKFAFSVSSVRAGNPQGYEWSLRPLVDTATENPLADLRASVAAAMPKAASDALALNKPADADTGAGQTASADAGKEKARARA